ncbi:MAG: hypothetical protein RLZZ196_63 [Bacteroidota bacterium]
MHQIVRGTTELAEFEIYVNGQVSTADGDVNVSISDANYGTSIGLGGDATFNEVNSKYTFNLDSTYTSLNRVLKVQWDYQVNGKQITSEDFYEVFTPYATVAKIIDYYNFGTKPQDLNYVSHEEIIQAERAARYQIDSYTGQSFGKYWGDQEVFGYNSDAMELVQRMVNIYKLYQNGELVIDYTQDPVYNIFGYDVELSTTNKALRIVRSGMDVIYDGQNDPTVLYAGKFRNHTRYKIYGELGWPYVPQDIQYCTLRLIGNMLSRDAQWRERYLKKIDLSEISFEMSNGAFNGTGDVIVDTILDQYRNTGAVVI